MNLLTNSQTPSVPQCKLFMASYDILWFPLPPMAPHFQFLAVPMKYCPLHIYRHLHWHINMQIVPSGMRTVPNYLVSDVTQ
jgi:hypothetical protein